VRLESAGSGAVRDVTIDARAIERRRVSDLTWSNGGRDIWELIREEQNLDRNYDGRFVTMGDRALIWRMPTFLVSDEQVDDAAGRLRGRQALILDLRGNSGGAMSAAERLLGHLFETDVHVADLIERHRVIAETARTRGDAFNGTVIVLVDQASASASEVVARTIQRLRRGVVIGDATAGAVMAAHYYGEQAGGAVTALYAMSITEADLVLDGGERLEHVGVQPDVRVLATSGDLASGRDPVLARALQRLGYAFDPAGAGRMFGPRAWGMW
jgi:C-terminal processing protease CtpA/Prc